MARHRSREAETEDVNERRLRRGAVKRQHIGRWAVGSSEIAPGVIGPTHIRPTVIERIIERGAGTGVGQLLVVSAAGQSFADGGDYVDADAIDYQLGFEGVVAAGDSIVWPTDAVGVIQVEFKWASFEDGGTIEIEVDGTVPPWGTVAVGTVGQEGRGSRLVHINEGAAVKVKVTQSSGSAQLGDVTVEFAIPDPTLALAAPPLDFLVESLWLDSKVGSVATVATLETGVAYRVVITGNYRLHPSATVTFGATEPVMFPSSGEAADNAEYDIDTQFAGTAAGSFPVHVPVDVRPLFDLGSGPTHLEPAGGPFSAPSVGHSYEYMVVGEGSPLSVVVADTPLTDNNGLLQIEVYA